jgi:hypothetical protein
MAAMLHLKPIAVNWPRELKRLLAENRTVLGGFSR